MHDKHEHMLKYETNLNHKASIKINVNLEWFYACDHYIGPSISSKSIIF